MNKLIVATLSGILFHVSVAMASEIPVDTVMLQEVEVSAIKQNMVNAKKAGAYTLVDSKQLQNLNIKALKGISDVVPNLYIPDYGSRITSSIYVRGLGARMDQPAVGLIIDNLPVLNKDAYDFDVPDMVKVEMLRGPQSTLYGRNTMCGLINVTTLSPLRYQGLRLVGEYGSGNTWHGSVGYYAAPSQTVGVAVIGSFNSTDGFYRNQYNGEKVGRERQWSGRAKLEWQPSGKFLLQNVASISNLNQSGYPYEYLKTAEINYNDTCFYRRLVFTDGFTMKWNHRGFTLSSITSFQYIDDNMTLDQDFLPIDYFTLTQKKHEYAFTQDFVLKSRKPLHDRYTWLVGLFGFYKHNNMWAPVTFKNEGIANLIESHRNSANPYYPIDWDTRQFTLNSDFTIPTYGVALYHQSDLKFGNFSAAIGLRLDYEHSALDYHSQCATGYDVYHRDDASQPLEYFRHVDIDINDLGNFSNHFLELLPKFTLSYSLPTLTDGTLYLSVSKGYKAGGFNTQMFSDVLQQRLMGLMGIGASYDVDKIVSYKPEKSWNYEVGTHLSFLNGRLKTEASLFYIDCRDQQLTCFPDGNTTGRIMTNAGKTRSFGGELSVNYRFAQLPLNLQLSYGYTNAKFREFDNGKGDFAGKYIPYSPSNTLFAQATYTITVGEEWLNNIEVAANVRGIGSIYWNEENSVKQPFYALLGASVTLNAGNFDLQFWAENITDTKHSTFYFVSMSNEFCQRGKPFRAGLTLRYNF
jgi:outer membrane receptor protein involved in Fe transport